MLSTCAVLHYSACFWDEVVRKREKIYLGYSLILLANTFPSFSFQPDDIPLEVLDAFKQSQEKEKNKKQQGKRKITRLLSTLSGSWGLFPHPLSGVTDLSCSFANCICYVVSHFDLSLGHRHLTEENQTKQSRKLTTTFLVIFMLGVLTPHPHPPVCLLLCLFDSSGGCFCIVSSVFCCDHCEK